jgi:chromosome segregation ATPase
MGLGNTAKKLQRVADMAETLYEKVDELRSQVNEVKAHVETTSQRVERIERDLDEQRAVLDALAREQDVDVDSLVAEAAIEEAEPGGGSGGESTASETNETTAPGE